MIRHICLFNLTPAAHSEGADAVIEKLDKSVKNMVGKIPGLISAEITRSAEDHDIIFCSEFENAECIAPYIKSELHTAHAQMAAKYVADRITYDKEV